ncbi:MAG: TIR domain-containing protein, partial [Planctomycetota bacterium]|nr:TIR domain-containing protein [Planctomycetota bacterium]
MAEAIRVFISYSHDSAEHSRRVLELSDRLRADGVDCNIDQYEVSPAERWPKWMDRQIEAAKFVLVVCTETYLRRVMGEEKPGTGLGVRWESLLVYQDLYDAGGENTKYVPVVFGVGDLPFVPKPLKGATYEVLDREEGYQKLLKRLDGVAAAKRPPLGIRAARPEFFQAPANNFREASVVRNADFVGREKLLKELHEQLGEADVALVHALSGEGGVGKSQLANEYAHRHNGDYEGMWWLDASRAGIDVSTAKVAEVMGLGLPVTAKPEEIRAAVCRRASAGKHLVILDNVDEAGVVEQWRMDRPGRVLVTTRRRDLPTARVRELEVNVLERGEAIELLRKHRADLKGQNNEAALGEVAGYLGDHALAVALVGAYLKQRPNVSAGKVLERLKRAEVGDEESLFEGLDPKDIGAGYTLKVAQSLALHFGELSELETAVLRVAAVCHPDGIPVDLFCKVLRKDEEEVEEALRGLASRSIVRYEPVV